MIGVAAYLYLGLGCAMSGITVGLLSANPGMVDDDFDHFGFACFIVLFWLPAQLALLWRNRH